MLAAADDDPVDDLLGIAAGHPPRRTASSTISCRRSREIVMLFSRASRNAWMLCSARSCCLRPGPSPWARSASSGLSHTGEASNHRVVVRAPDLQPGLGIGDVAVRGARPPDARRPRGRAPAGGRGGPARSGGEPEAAAELVVDVAVRGRTKSPAKRSGAVPANSLARVRRRSARFRRSPISC